MARTEGSFKISGALEPRIASALDARTIVQTKAELTTSGNFPYPYVGLETYVVAENKKYRLIADDPTDIANWEEVGGGGGSGGALEDLTDVELTDPTDGNVLKYDATSEKWVNASGGGGGGDAELEEAVTANTAAGAIEVGTTLPQGMTFTEFVKALVIAEVDPTINFSISQSGTVPSGSSYTETLTCAVTNMGSATKIKTISWYEGETLKRTDNVNSTVPATWTYTMSTATTETTTFKAVVTYTSSKGIDVSTEKTATITFGSYKYYGEVFSLDPTEAQVKALTEVAGNSRAGAYPFTIDDSRACYAYPKSFGALTKITDPNGFNLFYSFTRTEQTYTIGGQSVEYYRYVLTDEAAVENFVVTFE